MSLPRRLSRLIRSSGKPAARHLRSKVVRQAAVVSEDLEARQMMTAVDFTAQEQYLVELINRTRQDPLAEQRRQNVDLNFGLQPNTLTGEERQVLAGHQTLADVAAAYSRDLLTHNRFSHEGRDGSDPSMRVQAEGYNGVAAENLASNSGFPSLDRSDLAANIDTMHRDLWISASHRTAMLVNSDDRFREIGVGLESGDYTTAGSDGQVRDFDTDMLTELFGLTIDNRKYITGVVYDDADSGEDNDDFYSIGEGYDGSTGGRVVARNVDTDAETEATIGSAGGYNLLVESGTYEVRLEWGDSVSTLAEHVTVANWNVKVDFDFDEISIDDDGNGGGGSTATTRDLIGRVTATGQWWVATSDGTTLTNQSVGRWSPIDWNDVSVGDFDGDGRDDVYGRTNGGAHFVALANGDELTTSMWGQWSGAIDWVDLSVGDFNNDGRDDIVARHADTGAWYMGVSNGQGFDTHLAGRWAANVQWDDVMVADFDGDGNDDLAGRVRANGAWYLAVSDGEAAPTLSNVAWGRWSGAVDWEAVRLGDFNGDGRVDISGRNATSGGLFVAENTGDGFETERYGSFSAAVSWNDWIVGDFDGNGRDDLAARHAATGAWYGAMGDVDQAMTDEFRIEALHRWGATVDWTDVQAFDINADGTDEILGRNLADGAWWVMEHGPAGYANRMVGRWGGGDIWSDVATLDFEGTPVASRRVAAALPAVRPATVEVVSEARREVADLDELFADLDAVAELAPLT